MFNLLNSYFFFAFEKLNNKSIFIEEKLERPNEQKEKYHITTSREVETTLFTLMYLLSGTF